MMMVLDVLGRAKQRRRKRWSTFMASLVAVLLVECTGWKKWSSSPGPKPEGRRGHSLTMFGSKVIMFGGRGGDKNAFHLPRTFELVSNEGNLEFASYQDKAVPKSPLVRATLVEDDPFLEQCVEKIDDNPEEVMGKEECKFNGTREAMHYKENYIPIAPFFNDVWMYDLDCVRFADDGCAFEGWHTLDPGARLGGCRLENGVERCTHPYERYGHAAQVISDQILVIFGGYSQFCGDYCDDAWAFVLPLPGEPLGQTRWTRLQPISTPGKRWKFASTLLDSARVVLFGGHRLWHGFAKSNSRLNEYKDTDTLPSGGFLNDLWTWDLSECVYSSGTDLLAIPLEERRLHYASCTKGWEEIQQRQTCISKSRLDSGLLKPGYTWDQRNDQLCYSVWPEGRSGHGLVLKNNFLYLYGGYHTFYPYPTSVGPGAGVGTNPTSDAEAQSPFPSFSFFLDDFWKYNLDTGYWEKEEIAGGITPGTRTEHSFIATRDDILVLFGGYRSNAYLDDLWMYNTTRKRWLRKQSFVHPIYPENCTAGEQVEARPTQGTVLDGKFGRASEHVVVNITRRQAPGWDGCRDRADSRKDLPWELQWEKPSQRSNHAAAYSPEHEMMLVFGGFGFERETLPQSDTSLDVTVANDLWQFRMHQCVSNCSGQGECRYGFCSCHSGFYGLDCSNVSCPGDFCYYDEITNEQVCHHCCHAPYVHQDDDVYIPDFGKQACSAENPGRSNGICNGYGQCLCAPPFIGLDCAIKDCPNNCSGNGWCSEEYPVSRCMCEPGYTGGSCEHMECLNNCSYPNGICNTKTGTCDCMVWPNPYNRSRPWRAFGGMDCSFLIPFAGTCRSTVETWTLVATLVWFVVATLA